MPAIPKVSQAQVVTSLDQLEKLAQKASAEKAASTVTTAPDSVKFSIVEQDAHNALKQIIDSIKENKPLLYAALHACSIKPTEKGVKLIAANSVQQAQIEKEGEAVLRMLRDALREEGIELHVEADASKANTNVEKVPYTASEKFEYLANKNPLLRKLRDEFNLDVS